MLVANSVCLLSFARQVVYQNFLTENTATAVRVNLCGFITMSDSCHIKQSVVNKTEMLWQLKDRC